VGRHLVVDLSGHGYGHLAQVAPVLDALGQRLPGLRVTVRTSLAPEVVRTRVGGPLGVLPGLPDVGMAMRSGLEVDLERSLLDYARLHVDWRGRVTRAAAETRALAPDLVLANVPHRGLAAAAAAGLPSVALCSLNWAEIYGHYAGTGVGPDRVLEELRTAYRGATIFLQVRPHLPMSDLPRRRSIGPVAGRARARRAELDVRLGLAPRDRLVLVGLGGIDTRLPAARWPRLPGVRWLVPRAWGLAREDVFAIEATGLPFLDLLASTDLLLTKTGYGSIVEAACAGVPVLYVRRPDWPEEPYLGPWVEAEGLARGIDRTALEGAAFTEAVRDLLGAPRPRPVEPTGVEEAVDVLAGFLTRD
jgi:hypothetical protein